MVFFFSLKAEQSLQAAAKGLPEMSPCHNRMSSLDSTNSDESSIPTPQHCYGSVSSLISGQTNNMRDHYGSISSLASSTSLISQQELQGLIGKYLQIQGGRKMMDPYLDQFNPFKRIS